MDYLLRAEQQYREHFDHIARVNAEGWKTARIATRPQFRKGVARLLVALAMRLDRNLSLPPAARERPVVTTH